MPTILKTDRTLLFDTSSPTVAASTDTLAAAITSATQTSVTLTGSGGVTQTQNGAYISIAGDTMLVESGGGTTSLIVIRNAATATTHASGATVNCPGYNTATLPALATVPNQDFILNKVTADINYVKVVCSGSDTLPGGGTYLILADTSSTLGTAHVHAPAGATAWIQLGGAGAAGPAGSAAGSGPLTISFTGVPGVINAAYSAGFIGGGGVPPYTFTIISGSLPTGLSLSGSTISGTPTATGTFNFTTQIADSASDTPATLACEITISSNLPSYPAAPNVSSATGSVGYVLRSGLPYYDFSGTITLPNVSLANLVQIDVVAIGPDSSTNTDIIQTLYGPFTSGATINFQGEAQAQDTSASHTWDIEFLCFNEAGSASSSPYELTGITVNPLAVTGVTVSENLSSRTLQMNNLETENLNITITTGGNNASPQTVTIWLYRDAMGQGGTYQWDWQGWFQVTGSSTTIALEVYVPAANETGWQVAVVPGAVPNLATPPTGASTATFNVTGYGQASASDITSAAAISTPIYTTDPQGNWDWSISYQWTLPTGAWLASNDPNFYTSRIAVEKGKLVSGTWTTDTAAQPNGVPVGTGDIDEYATPGGTTSGVWTDKIPTPGDPYPSFRFHVDCESRASGSNNWVTQTGAFPSSVYSQFPGSNGTYIYITPAPQQTGTPLANDLSNAAIAGSQGNWAQQDANGWQYLSIPAPTYTAASPASDPNAEWVLFTVTVVDNNNNVIAAETPFEATEYGNPVSGPLLIAYANNLFARFKAYVVNASINAALASGGNAAWATAITDTSISTLQTTAWGGANHLDCPIGPVPAGAIPANRLQSATYDNAEFWVDPTTGLFTVKGVDFSKGFNFSTDFGVTNGQFIQQSVNMAKAAGFNGSVFTINNSGQFDITEIPGALVVGAVAAASTVTGTLQVGVAGYPGKLSIYDGSGNYVGWIGADTGTGGSGYVGAWFKRILIGGSSPASALFVADSLGNVALTGTISIGTGLIFSGSAGISISDGAGHAATISWLYTISGGNSSGTYWLEFTASLYVSGQVVAGSGGFWTSGAITTQSFVNCAGGYAINGSPVINSSGQWVGPAITSSGALSGTSLSISGGGSIAGNMSVGGYLTLTDYVVSGPSAVAGYYFYDRAVSSMQWSLFAQGGSAAYLWNSSTGIVAAFTSGGALTLNANNTVNSVLLSFYPGFTIGLQNYTMYFASGGGFLFNGTVGNGGGVPLFSANGILYVNSTGTQVVSTVGYWVGGTEVINSAGQWVGPAISVSGALSGTSLAISGNGTISGYLVVSGSAGINVTTGSLAVAGPITATNYIGTSGGAGGFVFYDRATNTIAWEWYGASGVAYIYNNSVGNVAAFTTTGLVVYGFIEVGSSQQCQISNAGAISTSNSINTNTGYYVAGRQVINSAGQWVGAAIAIGAVTSLAGVDGISVSSSTGAVTLSLGSITVTGVSCSGTASVSSLSCTGTLSITGWSVIPSGGLLYFQTGGSNIVWMSYNGLAVGPSFSVTLAGEISCTGITCSGRSGQTTSFYVASSYGGAATTLVTVTGGIITAG